MLMSRRPCWYEECKCLMVCDEDLPLCQSSRWTNPSAQRDWTLKTCTTLISLPKGDADLTVTFGLKNKILGQHHSL